MSDSIGAWITVLNQWADSVPAFRESGPPRGAKVVEEAEELRDAITAYLADPTETNREHIGEESGDLFMALLRVVGVYGVNLPAAAARKLAINMGREWEVMPNGDTHHIDRSVGA